MKMKFDKVVELLNEFDYKKNGKEETVRFLVWILNYLINEEDNSG